MTKTATYHTEQGTIFRISEASDGHLSVEVLKQPNWVPGPIGMAGLRVAPKTARLTDRQVRALPP